MIPEELKQQIEHIMGNLEKMFPKRSLWQTLSQWFCGKFRKHSFKDNEHPGFLNFSVITHDCEKCGFRKKNGYLKQNISVDHFSLPRDHSKIMGLKFNPNDPETWKDLPTA